MAATTPQAFDPDPKHLGLVMTFYAGSAILRGQVVGYADAGDTRTVIPAISTAGIPIGVALESQATTGGKVPVAMNGAVLTVMMVDDGSTLDAGHWVMTGAVAGCVIEWAPSVIGHVAVLSTGAFPVGYALKDSVLGTATAANYGSTVEIVVNTCPIWCDVN
jgi:hypothetical protein